MTSRELLALAVIALPTLAGVLFLLAPRGVVAVLARLACVPVAALALALTVVALRAAPASPSSASGSSSTSPADSSSA